MKTLDNHKKQAMTKKNTPKPHEDEKVDLKVESWQWETRQPRFNWKYALAFAVLIVVGLLFAFGFLVIAGVVLIIGLIINLVLFLVRRIS